jgi:hypothetical protein
VVSAHRRRRRAEGLYAMPSHYLAGSVGCSRGRRAARGQSS